MREHPLIMRGPLVRATLEGRKTQTRRPVQPWLGRNPPLWSRLIDQDGKPDFDWGELLYYGQDEDSLRHGFGFDDSGHGCPENDAWLTSPIGGAGDRLWVRETWCLASAESETTPPDLRPMRGSRWCYYHATEPDVEHEEGDNRSPWRPSIHMPRWACRLVLPLVSVRVERVQDITNEDAEEEGIREWAKTDPKLCALRTAGFAVPSRPKFLFRLCWISIYGEGSWDANPWVWVAEWDHIEVSK